MGRRFFYVQRTRSVLSARSSVRHPVSERQSRPYLARGGWLATRVPCAVRVQVRTRCWAGTFRPPLTHCPKSAVGSPKGASGSAAVAVTRARVIVSQVFRMHFACKTLCKSFVPNCDGGSPAFTVGKPGGLVRTKRGARGASCLRQPRGEGRFLQSFFV